MRRAVLPCAAEAPPARPGSPRPDPRLLWHDGTHLKAPGGGSEGTWQLCPLHRDDNHENGAKHLLTS